ncbi:hypothetical protein VWW31_000585 [Cronobacter sakazakii]|nr:hypothetical protein [Cronobacter sakazakii]EME2063208.1 hypothetical protein [Cronobacter sakazakii]EME2110709.1 hypothetical protein [Cronobacter sakazakii]
MVSELSELIASEIADFFAGFGGPGEPDIQNGEAQRLLTERVLSVLALRERAEPDYYVVVTSAGVWQSFHTNRAEAEFIVSKPFNPGHSVLEIYTAPPAPVVPVETFEEWSRRCEIQLTLCRPEFREVAEITWNACCAAMLAAPGKEG